LYYLNTDHVYQLRFTLRSASYPFPGCATVQISNRISNCSGDT